MSVPKQWVALVGAIIIGWFVAPFPCVGAQTLSGASGCLERAEATQDGTPALGNVLKRATQARHSEWYVSAATAIELVRDPVTMLVDTRRPGRFAEVRVPDSINVPGHAIKAKVFLRGKRLLLVNEGYSHSDLERTVTDLRRRGFDEVFIVEGGLAAWRSAGGPVHGRVAPDSLAKVSPDAFLKEQHYDHWQLVLLGPARATEDIGLPPVAEILPVNAAQENILARLHTLTQGSPRHLKPLILIVSADGGAYPRIHSAIGDTAPWNLFYLEGGLSAYKRQLNKIRAMRSRNARPLGGESGHCSQRRS